MLPVAAEWCWAQVGVGGRETGLDWCRGFVREGSGGNCGSCKVVESL